MGLLRASLWATLGNWGQQGISFVTMIIVARILSPSDFGVIAVALLFVLLVQRLLLESIGLGLVRIEAKHYDEGYRRTANAFAVVLGTLMSLGFYLLAEPLANLFGMPLLEGVLKAFSVLPLLEAIGIVHVGILRRDNEFKTLAGRLALGYFIGGATGIILAANGLGVWSLVWQQIVLSGVGALTLLRYSPWKSKFGWDPQAARRIKKFGIPMLGNAFVFVAANRVDVAFLGAFHGQAMTGIYNLSKRVVRTITDLTSSGAVQAQLTHLSNVGGSSELSRLNQFYSHLRVMCLITFPIYVGFAGVVGDVVPVVFGEQWSSATKIMALLLFFGPAQVIQLLATNYLVALGRSSRVLNLNAFSLLLSICGFFMVNQHGALGVAAVIVLVAYVMALAAVYTIVRLENADFFGLFKVVLPSGVCAGLMGGLVFEIRAVIPTDSRVFALLSTIFAGVFAYIALSWFIQRDTIIQVINALFHRKIRM